MAVGVADEHIHDMFVPNFCIYFCGQLNVCTMIIKCDNFYVLQNINMAEQAYTVVS